MELDNKVQNKIGHSPTEIILKEMSGSHSVTNRLNNRSIDNGKWKFTNERMFFKFMGFGGYEVSAFYDEIEYIASVGMGWYVVKLMENYQKSEPRANTFYWGVNPFKMKEVVALVTEHIGEERVAPPAKGRNIAVTVMLSILLVLLVAIIIAGLSAQ